MLKLQTAMVLLACWVGSASAALVIDQAQANPDRLIASGGVSGPMTQSFVAGYDNVAGVDLLLVGTGALTASASVELQRVTFRPGRVLVSTPGGNTAEALGQWAEIQTLASASLSDLPRSDRADALAAFRWAPVAVNPGETLYLTFRSQGLLLGSFSGSEAYAPGHVLAFGTVSSGINTVYGLSDATFYTRVGQATFDIAFRTYADVSPVPEASSMALALGGVTVAGVLAMRRRP